MITVSFEDGKYGKAFQVKAWEDLNNPEALSKLHKTKHVRTPLQYMAAYAEKAIKEKHEL